MGALAGRRFEGSVLIDWTWDSLRLGDGGEYGEEWGSMHERFDRGLSKLLQFYCQQDMNGDETVVILVTHGAGCNALLGALTRKPVLTDIPISSLSMAVLRPIYTLFDKFNVSSIRIRFIITSWNSTFIVFVTANFLNYVPFISIFSFSRNFFFVPTIADYRPINESWNTIPFDLEVLPHTREHARPSVYSNPVHRHPSLTLRTSSGLFGGSSKSDPPRTGLWTPTSSSSAAVSDERRRGGLTSRGITGLDGNVLPDYGGVGLVNRIVLQVWMVVEEGRGVLVKRNKYNICDLAFTRYGMALHVDHILFIFMYSTRNISYHISFNKL